MGQSSEAISLVSQERLVQEYNRNQSLILNQSLLRHRCSLQERYGKTGSIRRDWFHNSERLVQ
jgi:hypothetical protein